MQFFHTCVQRVYSGLGGDWLPWRTQKLVERKCTLEELTTRLCTETMMELKESHVRELNKVIHGGVKEGFMKWWHLSLVRGAMKNFLEVKGVNQDCIAPETLREKCLGRMVGSSIKEKTILKTAIGVVAGRPLVALRVWVLPPTAGISNPRNMGLGGVICLPGPCRFKSNHQGRHTSQSGLILNWGLFQKQDALREERKSFPNPAPQSLEGLMPPPCDL